MKTRFDIRQGVTLVELMVVIVAIGICLAIAIPKFFMKKPAPEVPYKHHIEVTCVAADGQPHSFEVTDYELGVEANKFVLPNGDTKLVQERCSVLDRTYR